MTWARLRTTEFKYGRGTEVSAAKRGFADHAIEMSMWTSLNPVTPNKALFVSRTIDEHMEMPRRSESRSLFIRVI